MLTIKVTVLKGALRNFSVVTGFFAGTGEPGQQAVCIDEAHEGEPFFAGEEITLILQQSIDLED